MTSIEDRLAKLEQQMAGLLAGPAPKKTRVIFQPPTPAMVDELAAEYAASKGLAVEPFGEAFCDFYEARGWQAGKAGKMKSWQPAVRTAIRDGWSMVKFKKTSSNGATTNEWGW